MKPKDAIYFKSQEGGCYIVDLPQTFLQLTEPTFGGIDPKEKMPTGRWFTEEEIRRLYE